MLRLLSTALLASSALAATAEQWQNRTIYQVCPPRHSTPSCAETFSVKLVTDRFAVDGDTGPSCDTSKRQYCGGSWKGVISKLDYIQNMGFDAIWISPIVTNIEGDTSSGQAYHG